MLGPSTPQKDFEYVYAPLKNVVSMVHPSDLAFGGWDCGSTDLVDAVNRAQVFEPVFQRQICPHWRMLHLSHSPLAVAPSVVTGRVLLHGRHSAEHSRFWHRRSRRDDNVFIAGDHFKSERPR